MYQFKTQLIVHSENTNHTKFKYLRFEKYAQTDFIAINPKYGIMGQKFRLKRQKIAAIVILSVLL